MPSTVDKMPLKRSDLDEIKTLIIEQIKSVFNEDFMKDLADRVSMRIDEKYNEQFKKQQEKIGFLEKEIIVLQKENKLLAKSLDNQEQLSRNLNIRIFGITQENDEDVRKIVLNLFTQKMKLNCIADMDIKNCYRVSAKTPSVDKPRPPAILVSFFNENKRTAVLKQRKILKSTGILIKEDLTKTRLNILGCATGKFSNKNAWCLNGNIYVKCNGIVHRISDEDDLKDINT